MHHGRTHEIGAICALQGKTQARSSYDNAECTDGRLKIGLLNTASGVYGCSFYALQMCLLCMKRSTCE